MKAFLDIETGGYSKEKNGLCEIALIAVDDDYNVIDTFHWLIKPYKREDSDELVSYKDDAMEVNGLTVEELELKGITIETAMRALLSFLTGNKITVIIGHNSDTFDIPWAKHLTKRFHNIIYECDSQDTVKIAKEKLKLPSYSLTNLLLHFGIKNDDSHRALGDSKATMELYKKLMQI